MERVSKGLAVLLVAMGLSGCGNIGKSNEERISDAMPPGSAVLASKQKLDAEMQALGSDGSDLQRAYKAKLDARAVECAGGYSASLFASAASVRDALTDKACFARSDDALREWLGMRRIGLLLAAPALRPIPATPPEMIVATDPIQGALFASRAGVALLQVRGKRQLIDIGNGVVLHETTDPQGGNASLSSNGRLLAAADAEGDTQILDAPSGDILASFKGRPAQFYWLDDVGALFVEEVTSESGKRRAPVFLDFSTGERQLIPVEGRELRDVLRVAGAPHRYVLLSRQRITEIELNQDAGAWKVRLVSEQSLDAGGYRPGSVVAVDGSYAVMLGSDARQLLIASRQLRTLPLQPLTVHTAMVMPDPDLLLLSLSLPGTYSTGNYVYSLGKGTLARVEQSGLLSRRFVFIPSLQRNGIIDGVKITVPGEIPTQPPMDVTAVVQQLQEEETIRSAERARQQGQMQEELSRLRATSEQERRDVDAAIAELELRALLAKQGQSQQARQRLVAAAPPPSVSGRLADLARTAMIEAIGVYEAGNAVQVAGTQGRTGSVQVSVRRGSKPIVLVLSAYEPVNWMLTVEPGANLAAVLVGGYHQGQVFGAGRAPVRQLGRTYAYKRGGSEYSALNTEVQRMTGKPIDAFQGRYDGGTFVTGM
ncbi:MAG: hypothetical protein ACREP4_12220 [Stenotrophomonas sp.]|uniref:hypothetical protein n=1 Tax=Stenotrophomonas sp. TaxID=69392 RepID=UPI003D6CDF4D